ncbi:MAG: hypothetical protein OSB14_11725, partial [Planctomycetota bacterium]|nr:hypothetical protein [Planctomycetota bacterium]
MLPLIKAIDLCRASLLRAPLVLLVLLSSCGSEVETRQSSDGELASAEVKSGAAPVIESAPTARGEIKFAKLTHDFGAVDDAEEVHCDFEFTNTGDG